MEDQIHTLDKRNRDRELPVAIRRQIAEGTTAVS